MMHFLKFAKLSIFTTTTIFLMVPANVLGDACGVGIKGPPALLDTKFGDKTQIQGGHVRGYSHIKTWNSDNVPPNYFVSVYLDGTVAIKVDATYPGLHTVYIKTRGATNWIFTVNSNSKCQTANGAVTNYSEVTEVVIYVAK
jgi:hypothetical protein